jgi:hypothetical protein
MTDASQIQARIAGNVRGELGRRKKSATDAAEVLNIHPQSMRARLNGDVPFTAQDIVRLAVWMGVSPAALIDVDVPQVVDRPRGSDPGVLGAEVLPGG